MCAYLPVGSEPGSPELVDALRAAGPRGAAAGGARRRTGPLDWARYTGPDALAAGPARAARAGRAAARPAAIARGPAGAGAALAVDRRGVRLGRGGGYYDRTLPLAAPGTPLVVVLHDEELVDGCPPSRTTSG